MQLTWTTVPKNQKIQSVDKSSKEHELKGQQSANASWDPEIKKTSCVVSIEFSPLSTLDLTTNWYQAHNGDYG